MICLNSMRYTDIPQSPPSLSIKTDSVINHMQYKIDSLSKIVNETKIGHDFFSDVISTNLYMFATIIGLAALLSWGWLKLNLYLHKKNIDSQVKELVASLRSYVDKDTSLIWKKLNRTHFDVNRLGYTTYQKNDAGTLFL